MTEKFNKTDSTIWGGNIDIEDFNTNFPNKNRINNQVSANELYAVLQKKLKNEKELEKYKKMTLEECKEKFVEVEENI